VGNGENNKAILALVPLVKQYPESALGLLYLGLANEQTGSKNEAVKCYNDAFRLPNAEAELRAWSEHGYDTARLLVAVGNFLYDDTKHYDMAHRACEIALSLDPHLEEAHLLNAREHARVKRCKPAFEEFTLIIKAAESRQAHAERNNLIAWYENRAKVSLDWGDQTRSQNQPGSSKESREHYQAALDDIKRGEHLFTRHKSDDIMRQKSQILTAWVKLALGDLETGLDRSSQAADLYHQASDLIKGLSPDGMQSKEEVDSLHEKVGKRLEAIATRK